MSDSGIYAAIEGEVYTALSTPAISGLGTLARTMSLEDLVLMDGLRRPAIGVVAAGAEKTGDYTVANRKIRATTKWEVAVLCENARGAVNGRATLQGLLETVRDRVHFLQSAKSPRARFRWVSDSPVQLGDEELVAAIATFELDVLFGT